MLAVARLVKSRYVTAPLLAFLLERFQSRKREKAMQKRPSDYGRVLRVVLGEIYLDQPRQLTSLPVPKPQTYKKGWSGRKNGSSCRNARSAVLGKLESRTSCR